MEVVSHTNEPLLWFSGAYFLDASLTFFGLEHGLVEGNPFLRSFNGPWILVLKATMFLLMVFLWSKFENDKLRDGTFLSLSIAYSVLCAWNFGLILE